MREKKIIATGVKWVGGLEIISRVAYILILLILAKIISPAEYGIFAFLMIFFRFTQAFGDFGLTAALIQKETIQSKHYYSSFWLIESITVLFAGITYLSRGIIGELFNMNSIETFYGAMIIPFIVFPYSLIPKAILNRELNFKVLALVDFTAIMINLMTTLILALLNFSVWAFIIGLYMEILVANIMLWKATKWIPRFLISFAAIKDLFGYSTHVFITRLFNFANLNIVPLLVSKFYGAAALGIYSITFQIVDFPVQRISKNIMKVLFPVLSKLQKDHDKFFEIFIKTVGVVLYVLIIVYALIYAGVQQVVIHFLWEKWHGVQEILAIMIGVGAIRAYWIFFSAVFLSKGKPQKEWQLHIILAGTFLLILAGMINNISGISGFLSIWLMAWLVALGWGHLFIFPMLGCTVAIYFQSIRRSIVYGFMVFIIFMVKYFWPWSTTSLFQGILDVVITAMIILMVFILVDRKKISSIKELLVNK
ncbi:MAG: lipopolysaccharide biosynthesis protein [Calditrichia bacterium]